MLKFKLRGDLSWYCGELISLAEVCFLMQHWQLQFIYYINIQFMTRRHVMQKVNYLQWWKRWWEWSGTWLKKVVRLAFNEGYAVDEDIAICGYSMHFAMQSHCNIADGKIPWFLFQQWEQQIERIEGWCTHLPSQFNFLPLRVCPVIFFVRKIAYFYFQKSAGFRRQFWE